MHRYQMIEKLFSEEDQLVYGSDEKQIEKLNLPFLWLFENCEKVDLSQYNLDYDDIIYRCRFLRKMPFEKGKKLIQRSIAASERMLLNNNIDVVYSLPIDSYVLHTLYIVAKFHKIKFFSLVGTLFSKRIRLSIFGELIANNEIVTEDNKITAFIEHVKNTSITPDWLIGTKDSLNKTLLKRFVVDTLKPPVFWLYRIFFNDLHTFSFPHYRFLKVRMFSTLRRVIMAKKIEAITTDPKDLNNYIFIPLQFYPEITSDYWVSDINLCNHHKVVLSIIDSYSGQKPFLIKEHPAAVGRRDEHFLKQLIENPKVYFAPLKYPMQNLIKNASLVVGNTSTTTINALIVNKPVIFFSKPYFALPEPSFFTSLEKEHLNAVITKYGEHTLSSDQVFTIVKQLFDGSVEGDLGGYIPIGEKSNVGKVLCTDKTRKYVLDYLSNQ